MRTVKRLTAIALAVLLIVSLLAGCSGGNDADTDKGGNTQTGNGGNTQTDNGGGDKEPQDSGKDLKPVLGREYAGEADPAAAILEKAEAIIEALPEGSVPEWDNKETPAIQLPPEATYTISAVRYNLEDRTVLGVQVQWDTTNACVQNINVQMYSVGELGQEPVRDAIFSDSLMDGLGDIWADCSAAEAWSLDLATTMHSEGGYLLISEEYGMTADFGYQLRYIGREFHREGNVLYYTEGNESKVVGLVEYDGIPENIIIPEELGGYPVTSVTFSMFNSSNDLVDFIDYYGNSIAIPKTAETVELTYPLPAIYILPETVKTLKCSATFLVQSIAPIIMCTGRDTHIEMLNYIEGTNSSTGRKPTIQAYFGSELARYALDKGWNVGYLDAIDGDRDAAREYLSGLLADELASLAAENPEDAAELAKKVTFDELLDLVMENWEDIMEDEPTPKDGAKEQLEKLRAGDYSVLEDAWQESHDQANG